jgi:hypothetical protein
MAKEDSSSKKGTRRGKLVLIHDETAARGSRFGYLSVVGTSKVGARKARPTSVRMGLDVIHAREIAPGLVARLLPEERDLVRQRFFDSQSKGRTREAPMLLEQRAFARLQKMIEQEGVIQAA